MAMFHLLKIRSSIDISKNEKCKVIFGLEYSCTLSWPFVLICLLSICNFLFISHVGFKSGIWLLIATVPVHCFSITYTCSF